MLSYSYSLQSNPQCSQWRFQLSCSRWWFQWRWGLTMVVHKGDPVLIMLKGRNPQLSVAIPMYILHFLYFFNFVYVYIYVYMLVNLHIYMCVYVYMCMGESAYTYMLIYLCMCVCVCVYVYWEILHAICSSVMCNLLVGYMWGEFFLNFSICINFGLQFV